MSISWESTVVSAVATNETQQFSADAVINKKVNIAVSGLQKYIQKYFINDITRDKDKELIADFMISCVKQESCKNSTKRVYAISLAYLCRYLASKKLDISLDEVSADMLYDYMTTFRPEATAEAIKTTTEKEKGDETSDEEETRLLQQQQQHQSWITTQQTQCNPLRKFYKWVAYPQLTAHQRKRLPKDKWPDVLRRFELAVKPTGSPMTPIKDSDIWEEKDIAIFLKYCTDYPRLRLFTSMAWETSGRPSELLELKIGDIEDNMQQDAKGEPCSILEVGRFGKNKYAHRNLGITKLSLQYYNRYLPSHPDSTNRKAVLFRSLEYSAIGRNLPISESALQKDYIVFRDKVIPKLLQRPDIPEEDKKHLKFIAEVRKWYPYIFRHSSLTRLANDPNVNEYALRKHVGWSKTSRMIEIYTHRRESVEPVMLAFGVDLKNSKKKLNQELRRTMTGTVCPFCANPNIPGTQLCVKCDKPIASNAMDAVMKEADDLKKRVTALTEQSEQRQVEKEKELEEIRVSQKRGQEEIESMKKQMDAMYNVIDNMQQVSEVQEKMQQDILHNNKLYKIAQKVQREQEEEEEYRKRSEQEAAKMVDKEMEVEFST